MKLVTYFAMELEANRYQTVFTFVNSSIGRSGYKVFHTFYQAFSKFRLYIAIVTKMFAATCLLITATQKKSESSEIFFCYMTLILSLSLAIYLFSLNFLLASGCVKIKIKHEPNPIYTFLSKIEMKGNYPYLNAIMEK